MTDKAGKAFTVANVLMREGRPELAEKAYLSALGERPKDSALFAHVIAARRQCAAWQSFAEDQAWLLEAAARGLAVPPFLLMTLADAPPALHHAAARLRAGRLPLRPLDVDFRPLAHDPRVRLGFLCGEFRAHATTSLVREAIERLDRARFEVIGYDSGEDDGSEARRDMLAAFDRTVALQTMGDDAAARRIRDDGVAILVDLNGYCGRARPGILAFRPAPLAVSYLSYPGTLGTKAVDYILADPVVLPGTMQSFFDEAILHLPVCYQPNDSRRHVHPPPGPRAAYGLPEGFVFASFNAVQKLTPSVFDGWMRLLQAVPGSVLWLLAAGVAANNLRREAAARGVAPERIVCAPMRGQAEHLARLSLADFCLDTFPYNGHTTTTDALWEGVPVVTRKGDNFASRVAASLLTAAELPELVADSAQAYEALALELAQAPERLAGLRRRLAARSAPLFDMARQTRDLEAAFEAIWRRWCEGLPPQPMTTG